MGLIIFITGGSASGKSEIAESVCCALDGGPKIYVATMRPDGNDDESRARIEKHRQRRGALCFSTIERQTNLESLRIEAGRVVLLECLSNLLANEMYAPFGAGDEAQRAVTDGIGPLRCRAAHLVLVSGDVFGDGADYAADTKQYQTVLGRVNRYWAMQSDIVMESVCGIPVLRKTMRTVR